MAFDMVYPVALEVRQQLDRLSSRHRTPRLPYWQDQEQSCPGIFEAAGAQDIVLIKAAFLMSKASWGHVCNIYQAALYRLCNVKRHDEDLQVSLLLCHKSASCAPRCLALGYSGKEQVPVEENRGGTEMGARCTNRISKERGQRLPTEATRHKSSLGGEATKGRKKKVN